MFRGRCSAIAIPSNTTPDELARSQERLAALQGLMRSYGPRYEDVVARREEAASLVSMVDDADEHERRAQRVLEAAESRLAEAATSLHEARLAAAPRFSESVSSVMSRLEMGTAMLTCSVELLPRESWSASGPSSVEFFFRPGARHERSAVSAYRVGR